jgi:cytoskeleton protein RodZ
VPTALRVKRSTLQALALVAPRDEVAEPATWKLMERSTARSRGRIVRAPGDGALDVGALLHAARRRRRISLARASEETCIPRRYIEALERNRSVEAFPGAIYARGFLRTYARYLRIADADRLVARFDGASPTPICALVEAVPAPGAGRGRTRLLVLMAALVAGAAIVATSGSSHPVRASFPSPFRSVAPAPTLTAEEPAPRTAVALPAAGNTLAITVDVTEGSSWLRVVADGKALLRGRIVSSSFEQTFEARRRLDVIVGNAGSVRVLVGGRWQGPIGPAGQVRRIVVILADGLPVMRVSARP